MKKSVTRGVLTKKKTVSNGLTVQSSQFLKDQLGVIAQRDYKKGDILFTVEGPITKERTIYTFPLSFDEHIDPRNSLGEPSLGHFLNHSCSPNSFARIIKEEWGGYVEIVARRKIASKTELTINYALMEYEVAANRIVCICGAKKCTGVIVGYKDLPLLLKEQYLLEGIVVSYLVELDNNRLSIEQLHAAPAFTAAPK